MAEVFDFGLQQHKIKMDGKFFESNLFAVAGDTGRRLEVQLLDSNNMVQNTTGISLRLNANVAGQATYAEATLVDATKGLYELDLPNGMLIAPGNWQFQWQIIGTSGEKLHSFAFTGSVGSNLSEGGSEATNFYLNVDDLKQMQEDLVNGTFNSEVLETNIAEKLNNLETQYAPKLTEVTAQLEQTNDKVSLKVGDGKLATMADIGQDIKEAMTGGSVAVVGKNSVLKENIVDNQVNVDKADFLKYGKNKFNPDNAKDGYSQNSSGVEAVDSEWSLSEFIPVISGIGYRLTPENTSYKRPSFHDANHTFVELINAGSAITIPTSYTPQQDGYIRVPVRTDGKWRFSVTKTSESVAFEPFTMEGVDNLFVHPKENSVGDRELKDKIVTPEKTTFVEKSKNMFDKNSPNIAEDFFLGSSTPNELYNTSDYMPIKIGMNYTISHSRRYEITDDGKTEATRYFSELSDGYTPVTFTSDRDGYLRVSYYKETVDGLQVEAGVASTNYEPYSAIKIPNLIFDNLGMVEKDVLYGKKMLNFGDSISTPDFGYHEIIAEKYNMTLRDLGAGGYTVVKREGYEVDIINRVNTAISEGVFDYDYILFNGLTNDSNVLDVSLKGEITQGYDDPLDLYTFAGAFENLVKTLILNWPKSKIIYIRPHNMDSRNSRQIIYGDLALEICRKWAIPCVDMYNEGGLNTQIPLLKTMYTLNADGTHPNEDGYRMFYVPRIEAKMKSV